jgi:TupA-like ATPgrasp
VWEGVENMRRSLKRFCSNYLPPAVFLVLRFIKTHHYVPNLYNPKTFNEKIVAKMLFDRSPLLPIVADKLAARDFITSRIGDGYLPKLYAVWNNASSISLDPLWHSVVIKANHGSGYVRVVPNILEADVSEIKTVADQWLNENFGKRLGEWCYHKIEPLIFAEEMLGSGNLNELIDYKIFCFSGEPKFFKVIKGMTGVPKSFYADLSFSNMGIFDGQNELELKHQIRPSNLAKMLDLASKLSFGFDMVRVDMYSFDGKIYIGELTNYPQCANAKLYPKESDLHLGSFWKKESMYYLPFK